MANSTLWRKERPPLLLKCPTRLGRCCRSFLAHQDTSYILLFTKSARSCWLTFQQKSAKPEHLGMTNGMSCCKKRLPLFLKCPTSLGRCWGRSEKLPCPPVHLLHITLGQASTKLHDQISARSPSNNEALWGGKWVQSGLRRDHQCF